jgi:GTP cyclohydrolase I
LKRDHNLIRKAIRDFLIGLGEDPERDGIKETPDRVARMWMGFNGEEKPYLKTFKCEYSEMVVVKELPFYSFCEHHLVPFFGVAKIGYLPKKKVLGLSKVARILDFYALRPQIQEQLTMQVAKDLMSLLKPSGVGVIIEAEHLCMSMRGVKKPGHRTVTSCLLGKFQDAKVREEFLKL